MGQMILGSDEINNKIKNKMGKVNKMGFISKVEKKDFTGKPSIPVRRFFTKEGVHPFDEVEWVKRDASVKQGSDSFFEQKGVEFPSSWSRNAVNITVSKYFYGKLGSPEREYSLRQVISRVTKKISEWGREQGHFSNEKEAQIFEDELTYLILHQKGSFNSPVWFNVGTIDPPQTSACFILSVKDEMESILDWVKTEGLIFKLGSGSGVNLSPLRSKREELSGGGYASGPVSFMRGSDSIAGMIKSGGTTRRAAKMVVLDIDHPDIVDFIRTKADEEDKIKALSEAGYNMMDLNNEGWYSIQFQNANNSVRITDEFMETVRDNKKWKTKYRVSDKDDAPEYDAGELLEEIAKAAWKSGDPGVQFDTTINEWHTCPNSGRINASNPCSEYLHLDDSACNLASLNLLKFLKSDGSFAVDEFKQAVDIFILAQEIAVDGGSYPTKKITENAHNFRELGLGFSNLGAFLMTKGIPYDSEEGTAWGGAIASIMTGEAYRQSAVIAKRMDPFNGYEVNREPMLKVIEKHRGKSREIDKSRIEDKRVGEESSAVWDRAYDLGQEYGFRNSQTTVIAPTGTISFMMDCDTTGIEPDFSLIKMKQLVGGGWMKIVNGAVKKALENLGYKDEELREIVEYISKEGTVEGAPYFKEEHLPIFDCAAKPEKGTRVISWRGHVRMVAAVQSFVSGAISKTFNMSNDTSAEEIAESYKMAWESGIKAFAVYRDGSKASQPLHSSGSKKKEKKEENKEEIKDEKESKSKNGRDFVERRRLPNVRKSETHKFSVVGHEGYLTYGMYDDGRLGEIFIRMSKQGSTLSGLLDSFSISVSLALQYGVPLKSLASKFVYSRFEPAGVTENPDIRISSSIVDYIFRYLSLRFLNDEDLADFGMSRRVYKLEEDDSSDQEEFSDEEYKKNEDDEDDSEEEVLASVVSKTEERVKVGGNREEDKSIEKKKSVPSANVCKKCGGMMVRTGTCETCIQCGETSGGCS